MTEKMIHKNPRKTGIYVQCADCKTEIYLARWQLKDGAKYCSKKCYANAITGIPLGEAHREKISMANSGSKHYFWNGGKYKNWCGYIMSYQPQHPNADSKGYVREHRLVMEKHLGRYLKRLEVVHHIDGNKSNNDISNLQLFKNHSSHLKHEWWLNHNFRNI